MQGLYTHGLPAIRSYPETSDSFTSGPGNVPQTCSKRGFNLYGSWTSPINNLEASQLIRLSILRFSSQATCSLTSVQTHRHVSCVPVLGLRLPIRDPGTVFLISYRPGYKILCANSVHSLDIWMRRNPLWLHILLYHPIANYLGTLINDLTDKLVYLLGGHGIRMIPSIIFCCSK